MSWLGTVTAVVRPESSRACVGAWAWAARGPGPLQTSAAPWQTSLPAARTTFRDGRADPGLGRPRVRPVGRAAGLCGQRRPPVPSGSHAVSSRWFPDGGLSAVTLCASAGQPSPPLPAPAQQLRAREPGPERLRVTVDLAGWLPGGHGRAAEPGRVAPKARVTGLPCSGGAPGGLQGWRTSKPRTLRTGGESCGSFLFVPHKPERPCQGWPGSVGGDPRASRTLSPLGVGVASPSSALANWQLLEKAEPPAYPRLPGRRSAAAPANPERGTLVGFPAGRQLRPDLRPPQACPLVVQCFPNTKCVALCSCLSSFKEGSCPKTTNPRPAAVLLNRRKTACSFSCPFSLASKAVCVCDEE